MIKSPHDYSFWAVIEHHGGFLIHMAQYKTSNAHYDNKTERVWFIRIEGKIPPCIVFFPYLSTFNLSLEIRSNSSTPIPITEEISDTATNYYPEANTLSDFESGPIIGLFHYKEQKRVDKCIEAISLGIINVPLRQKAEWAVHTNKILRWISMTIPWVTRTKTPFEVLGIKQ